MRVYEILIFIGDSTLLQFVQNSNGGVIKLQTLSFVCVIEEGKWKGEKERVQR